MLPTVSHFVIDTEQSKLFNKILKNFGTLGHNRESIKINPQRHDIEPNQ